MKNQIWISRDILDCILDPGLSSGAIESSYSEIHRAYEVFNRASTFITLDSNKFDLSDGILNLKRSIDIRLKLIEKIYKFKKLIVVDKPKHCIDMLAYIGLIRPLVLKELFIFRNGIEHKDANPPSVKKCINLLDATWYFLKSTDGLVETTRNAFELFDRHSCGDINIDYPRQIITIHGRFSIELLSEIQRDGFYRIKLNTKEIKKICSEKFTVPLRPDERYIVGRIQLTPADALDFYRRIFLFYC